MNMKLRNKKNSLIVLTLTFTLILSSFTACGSSLQEEKEESKTKTTPTSVSAGTHASIEKKPDKEVETQAVQPSKNMVATKPAVKEEKPASTSSEKTEITLQINYPAESELENFSKKITIAEGQSVLECLVNFGKENEVPVVYSGSKSAGYVEGINGCFEFDQGPESGWVYSVNDAKPQKSSGSYKLQNGDTILWQYIYSLDNAF